MLPEPVQRAVEDIRSMKIRGASLIARHAVEALVAAEADRAKPAELHAWARALADSRPTASSLHFALGYVLAEGPPEVPSRARTFRARVDSSEADAARAAAAALQGHVVTHCNSQAQVQAILQAKRVERVTTLETRPRHQGRLTTQQLARRVPVRHMVDGAMALVVADADVVLVGADTIAGNGDVVNKVGTHTLAIVADELGVPLLVVAETFKVAPWYDTGAAVPIELRPPDEVWPDAPAGVEVANPAFDVTPTRLVTTLYLETGPARDPVEAVERAWGRVEPVLPGVAHAPS